MRSRAILNWALLCAVVILAAVVYFTPAHKDKPPPPLIAGMTPRGIEHIHIARPGKPDIDLVRKYRHWQLTAPLHTAANGFRADALASVVEADSDRRFNTAGQDLAKFGLKPPRARLQLDNTTVAFGDREPISGSRYVQVGDVIHLIPDYYFQSVTADVPDFVSLSPLPGGAEPVRFTLTNCLALKRNKDCVWAQIAGDRHADARSVNEFVGHWRQAEALEVTRYTPAGSHDTVTVGLDQGHAALVFDIVSRRPELVLGRRDLGMAYHFPASQTAKLLMLSPAVQKTGDKAATDH